MSPPPNFCMTEAWGPGTSLSPYAGSVIDYGLGEKMQNFLNSSFNKYPVANVTGLRKNFVSSFLASHLLATVTVMLTWMLCVL